MTHRVPKLRTSIPRILLGVAFGLAACDRESRSRNGPAVAAPQITTYEAHGVLRNASKDRRKAVIAHEAIPGYMEPMTMEFEVRDSSLPEGLEPGDQVAFRLSITETNGWIDHVRKIGRSPNSASPEQTPARSVVATLPVGAPLPDCALVDQRGQTFRLGDFKGQALAFTFIFTRCPLPNFCPLMNRNLAAAQRELSAAGASANWHLLSISFDPEYDTPERLAEYARPNGVDSGHWTFATGAPEDLRELGRVFGLEVVSNGAQIDHTLRTVVVDATGHVQRIFVGNGWKVAELIDEMQRAMTVKP
jgi:protein SCO1/2